MRFPVKFALALTTLVLFGSENSVFAMPFKANPSSFSAYLNSLNWNNGASTRFYNLYNCRDTSYIISNYDSPRVKKAQEQIEAWGGSVVGGGFFHTSSSGLSSFGGLSSVDSENKEYRKSQAQKWGELANKYAEEDGRKISKYECNGYATLSDPRGVKVCKAALTYDSKSTAWYSLTECVWK